MPTQLQEYAAHAVRYFTPEQLALLKRNIGGGDLSNDEFSLFMETAKHLGLDPFKRQIVPIVFNAKDPKKRRVEHVITVAGYRSIAARLKDWGPWADEAAILAGKEPQPNPQVFFNEALVDPQTNPLGIDYAIYLCKKYRPGSDERYDIVMGKARWVERVPLKQIWRDNQPSGEFYIHSDQWKIQGQPAHMIGKCAEADCLRRGWPDETSGAYGEEEMQRAQAMEAETLSAAEAAEKWEADQRMKRVGGDKAIGIVWDAGEKVSMEDPGELPDKVMAWLRHQEHPLAVQKFEERNAAPLNQLWAISKSDGLGVKEAIEKRSKELSVIDVEDEQEAENGAGVEGSGEGDREGPA